VTRLESQKTEPMVGERVLQTNCSWWS